MYGPGAAVTLGQSCEGLNAAPLHSGDPVMTKRVTSFLSALAVAGMAAYSAVPALADGAVKTMGPLKGIMLDVGSKKAIGYYRAANGACNLTLVLAEPSYSDAAPYASEAVRISVSVHEGTSARIDQLSGPSLAFACAPKGEALTVQTIDRVAYVAPSK
jgi:hypothetical protein